MYPEITPLIRDAIKRRYELIPYLYSLMLESHSKLKVKVSVLGCSKSPKPVLSFFLNTLHGRLLNLDVLQLQLCLPRDGLDGASSLIRKSGRPKSWLARPSTGLGTHYS